MKRRRRPFPHQIPWLPIDSRLIPSVFSFGHVRGISRIFLEIEIVLAVLVVLGTLVLMIVKLMKGL